MFEGGMIFDYCPNCKSRSLFRMTIVYQCPACFRFYCDKCRAGGWLTGYKCPHCSLHTPGVLKGRC